ncbi:hypothetical protein L6164_009274 [Bauhinia variegata]|uniref:Uncharacterized protein n=1 Tax=Bauhinia variegata TaxID=167791 RepID=A0ACB9PIK4_BAUVA|nr:hypothetical protein L6164_009274 [Bauhinia variegata]
MGKAEEQPLHSSVVSQDSGQNVEASCGCGCATIRKFIGLRCIFVMLLSVAVFLSAVFWLPPFVRYADQRDLRPDATYKGHDIVASFILNKPVSLLQDNILQLEDDIFEEIPVPSTKVTVLSLDPLSGSNKTKVVFAVDPDGKYSEEMSQATVSLIRASFKELVINQSILRLTSSLFGDTGSFEVLRFKGGITVVPPQKAFPLQKQSLFNFTLNSSIDQIRMDFLELTTQLKSGLHLASYENLYVILSNTEGSTVAPPTIVQASIILDVGNNPPSSERLKQLAQTIANSHSKNLGLNHTEFGRVKQVRLSSILQHSLHGHDGSGTAWSPSPAPLTHPHHHHHHHHHGHHHHHHNAHLAPAVLPAHVPAPAPANGRGVTPPAVGSPAAAKSVPPPRSSEVESPNCQFGHRKRPTSKAGKHSHLTPAVAPITAPHNSAASPKRLVEPPAHVSHSVPALSPLPNVAFAHAEPPPKNEPAAEHSNSRFHGPSTSSSSSSAGHIWTVKWASLLFLVLVLHV